MAATLPPWEWCRAGSSEDFEDIGKQLPSLPGDPEAFSSRTASNLR